MYVRRTRPVPLPIGGFDDVKLATSFHKLVLLVGDEVVLKVTDGVFKVKAVRKLDGSMQTLPDVAVQLS